jgi:hypothetical protein
VFARYCSVSEQLRPTFAQVESDLQAFIRFLEPMSTADEDQ